MKNKKAYSLERRNGEYIQDNQAVIGVCPTRATAITALTEVTLLQIPKHMIFGLCSSHEEYFKKFLQQISDYALIL